jgi:catechol 2,3-dioxygenase-like lactoylglutathione lyase family enzyme
VSSSASPLSKIGVIMLGAADLDRSVAFYQDRLGLPLTGKHEGFAFFAAGEVSLALSEPLARSIDKPAGPVEVVFSVEHVRESHAALLGRGVAFDIEPRAVAGPMWAANFRDPDGHQLSLFGPE